MKKALRSGREPGGDSAGIPPEVQEDLVLDHYARHYRKWLDEEIPALDGYTPRAAAKDPRLLPKLEQLIRGLEDMYLGALRRNQPAYDPSWMWAELGLADGAQPEHPPELAHERWAEATAGFADVCRAVAERVRGLSGFDDVSTIMTRDELEADLDVRRLLKGEAAGGADGLLARLYFALNLEVHRRKTFWVDEALVYMLAQTDLDVVGEELRVPFPCFALVFTDRHVLSLCERVLAAGPACPLAGHLLRVATVYVTEEDAGSGRVLHFGVAVDALAADPPHLFEHELLLKDGERVEGHPAASQVVVEGQGALPSSRPLPALLPVVLNVILYATSAGVEPQVRASPRKRMEKGAEPGAVFSSEEVFFLPGKIKISSLRQMQELDRVPSGRKLLHRFMVRGHWRRPAKSWREQRMRWIEPYWKGPDMAAVIERTYKLTP